MSPIEDAIIHARRAAVCRLEAERDKASAGMWLAVADAESQRSRKALSAVTALHNDEGEF